MISVQNQDEQKPIPPSFFWMQPPGQRKESDANARADAQSERGRRLSDYHSGGDRASISPRRLGTNDDGEDEFVIHPRRKAGQDTADSKGPVVLTRSILEGYFDLPLISAAAEMGLSCTALKKVCRKMGISNWPYRFRDELCRSGSLSPSRSPSRSPPRSPTSQSPVGSPRQGRPTTSFPIQQRLQSAIEDTDAGGFPAAFPESTPILHPLPDHGFRSINRRHQYSGSGQAPFFSAPSFPGSDIPHAGLPPASMGNPAPFHPGPQQAAYPGNGAGMGGFDMGRAGPGDPSGQYGNFHAYAQPPYGLQAQPNMGRPGPDQVHGAPEQHVPVSQQQPSMRDPGAEARRAEFVPMGLTRDGGGGGGGMYGGGEAASFAGSMSAGDALGPPDSGHFFGDRWSHGDALSLDHGEGSALSMAHLEHSLPSRDGPGDAGGAVAPMRSMAFDSAVGGPDFPFQVPHGRSAEEGA